MGQAGAQREPSMEEILASIRRIIENNEPAEGENPTNFDDGENHDLDDAYAVDQAAGEPAKLTAAEIEPLAQPVSLADVAARTRLVAEAPVEEEPVAVADTEETGYDGSDMTDMDDVAAEQLRDALASNDPVEAPASKNMASVDVHEKEPVADQSQTAAPAKQQESSGQLVSLQTGEKVAAAFGELDAAIIAGQRRSFDEIAEEMLRPMLTQWLDDNLPTLVERLVREEIERVSRGNRN